MTPERQAHTSGVRGRPTARAGLRCPLMASTAAAPQLLSREETARALGVSLRTLSRLTASGELAPVRVSPGRRLVRYAPEDVAAFIRRNRDGRPPTPDPTELDYR